RIDQQGVDGTQIVFAELAGGGLEQQAVDQGVVACPRQVSLSREQLLLRIQNVDVDSNTDLVAEQVRIECEPTRAFGRLQGAHLRQAAVQAQKGLASRLFGPPSGGLEIGQRAL